MRAATVRRLLVFGVCAFGVSCLYLVPSMARSPGQLVNPRSDRPLSEVVGPTASATITLARTTSAPTARRTVTPTGRTVGVGVGDSTDQPAATETPLSARLKRTGATAFDPQVANDDTPPDPVTSISFGPVTRAALTVTWAPARDDNAVIGYRVWLNGFAVATTAETHVTINWFNDDSSQHVVQVKALDAAGNESTTSPNALVDRPTDTPSPTVTPSPTESATPVPTPTPTPTESTQQPTPTPTDQPTQESTSETTPTASPTGQN